MADTRNWMKTTLTGWGAPTEGFGYTDASKTCDHENEGVGVVFQVQEDCSITHGTGFCDAVTGTSPYWKMQLWPMSTSYDGQPDMTGTVLAETAEFQGTVEAGWPYTKLLKQAFTSPYSATAGQTLCCLLKYSSGTIDGSNSCNWDYASGRASYRCGVGGYLESYSGSATTWYGNGTYQPRMTVTTDKTYDLGGYPHLGEANYYMGVSGYRYANKITLPAADPGLEMHVVGLQICGNIANGTDSIIAGAWDSDGDELIADNTISTVVSVGQQMGDIGFYLGVAEIYFKETLTIVSGGTYYLGIENDSGTLYGAFKVFDDWADDCNRSWPMGANIEAAIYLPFGGGWADNWAGSGSDKTRFLINPIVSDIHGTSSGGGGSANATMISTMGVMG